MTDLCVREPAAVWACCSYLEQENVYSGAFWGSRDQCGIGDTPFVTSNKPECEAWTASWISPRALEQMSHSMDEPRRCWWPLHHPKGAHRHLPTYVPGCDLPNFLPSFQYLPPPGFVQPLIILPLFTPPWNKAGSMDKFSDQFNPWRGWSLGMQGCIHGCALVPQRSQTPHSIPSHLGCSWRSSLHTKTPLDQGVRPRIFPLILPKCLDLKATQLQWFLPPVKKATWPKNWKVLVGISCTNEKKWEEAPAAR